MTQESVLSGKIKFSDVLSEYAVLVCPRCNFDYLHHRAVKIFDRSEDADTVIETIVSEGIVSVNPKSIGEENPSRRRHGLRIEFYCEGCGGEIDLTIAQHKGQTFMAWSYNEAKK